MEHELDSPASRTGPWPWREPLAQPDASRGVWRWVAASLLALAAAFATVAARAAEPQVERDIAYGDAPRQRFDVYLPEKPAGPVIFMLHGGAWAFGDKASPGVVGEKMRYWTGRGYVFVSANYRLLPEADPLTQAADAARALAAAQRRAAAWGADPSRFVLMGHSAGAHLVALLNASPALAAAQGAQPWRGAVSLDSAALDVVMLMRLRHAPLYDRAFGADPAYWRAVSPWHVQGADSPPLLAVCAARRVMSCAQARALQHQAGRQGRSVQLLPQDLDHMEINARLGEPGDYTETVARWISSIL